MIAGWIFQLLYYILQLPFSIGLVLVGGFHLILSVARKLGQLLVAVLLYTVTLPYKVLRAVVRLCKKVALSFYSKILTLKNKLSRAKIAPISFASVAVASAGILAGLITTLTVIGWLYIKELPYPTGVADVPLPQPILIYDRNTIPLFQLYTNSINASELEKIPTLASSAVMSGSDQLHQWLGVDWRYVTKAAQAVVLQQQPSQPDGIAHNLAQRFRNTKPTSVMEIFEELLLAIKIQSAYSEEQLARLYLATAPIGQAVGFENASSIYFGIPAHSLSLSETMYLLALLENTRSGTLISHTSDLEAKYQAKLSDLKQSGLLSLEQYQQIAAVPQPHPYIEKVRAANATMLVLEEAQLDIENTTNTISIQTTIDLALQNQIQKLVIENAATAATTAPQVSILVTHPVTGEVLAFTGEKLDHSIFREVVKESQRYHSTAAQSSAVHSIASITDSSGMKLVVPNNEPVNSFSSTARASSTISATYTESAVITVWVSPELTQSQPTILTDIMDSIADYLLHSINSPEISSI